MEHLNLYFFAGATMIVILMFTKCLKWKSFPTIAVFTIVFPPVGVIVLAHILKIRRVEKDIRYTLTNGKCKKCGDATWVSCETGTNRSASDIYAEVMCPCRDGNSWAHFDDSYELHGELLNYKKNKSSWSCNGK